MALWIWLEPGANAGLTFGNLTTTTTGVTITNGTGAVIGLGTAINIQTATGAQPGLLSAADWNTFNNKQNALAFGNLTASGTANLTITGTGAGALIGAGAAVNLAVGNLAVGSGLSISAGSGTGAVVGAGLTISLGTVAINQGGTGQVTAQAAFDALSPLTTQGDLLYRNATQNTRLATGTYGQYLRAGGSGANPFWGAIPEIPPTIQRFTSGSGNYDKNYAFIVSGASATVGATYTNNGVTYTVWATVASANLVYMWGNGDPTSSGTLTKSAGTGDASIAFTEVYKPYLEVLCIGGGGGGAGGGSSGSGNGGNGNDTTFGTVITAGKGLLAGGSTGGAGGAPTVNSPGIYVWAANGATGSNGPFNGNTIGIYLNGADGGETVMGGRGRGGSGVNATNGETAQSNTGSGGGGGGTNAASIDKAGGGGGGAGATVLALIPTPGTRYAYSVGSGGSAGTAGTNGYAGGAGATGIIVVTERYLYKV